MEQYSDSLTCIIFVLEPCDIGIYEVLLPFYFPRNLAEQDNACWQLPTDIGGPDGEPLLPDRQIRIIDNPQHALHGKVSHFALLSKRPVNDNSFKCLYRIRRRRNGRAFGAIGDLGEHRRARFRADARRLGSPKTSGRETTCRPVGGHHVQANATEGEVRG